MYSIENVYNICQRRERAKKGHKKKPEEAECQVDPKNKENFSKVKRNMGQGKAPGRLEVYEQECGSSSYLTRIGGMEERDAWGKDAL